MMLPGRVSDNTLSLRLSEEVVLVLGISPVISYSAAAMLSSSPLHSALSTQCTHRFVDGCDIEIGQFASRCL